MSRRVERVNELIKREVSQIILREFELPQGILLTVTRVNTFDGLNYSKVFVSVLPDSKTGLALKILKKGIFGIQQKINKKLNFRPVPRIEFFPEKEVEKADRIEKLLEEINKDKQS